MGLGACWQDICWTHESQDTGWQEIFSTRLAADMRNRVEANIWDRVHGFGLYVGQSTGWHGTGQCPKVYFPDFIDLGLIVIIHWSLEAWNIIVCPDGTSGVGGFVPVNLVIVPVMLQLSPLA